MIPLNNLQIEEQLKNIEHFRGVFSHDTLPKKIHDEESGVINLDNKNGSGTHWVAYCSTDKSNITYLDSFGLPPSDSIASYLKGRGHNLLFNSSQFQRMTATPICGYYCIDFIKHLSSPINMSAYDYLLKFKQEPTGINEQIIAKNLSN